jgi:hypothetical protein
MGLGTSRRERGERPPELVTEHPYRLHTANVTSAGVERFDEHGE